MPSENPSRRRAAAVVILALVGMASAACSGGSGSGASADSSTPGTSPTGGGASQVNVTLTGAGSDACSLDTSTVPAGPVTFTVTNQDSAAISEVELLSDERIIGEKENLAPGLAPVSFTVTLGGGSYQVYCPGAAQEMVDLTVTGEAAPTPSGGVSAVLKEGTDGYATYVNGVVTEMVTAIAALKDAIDAGDLEAAKAAYAKARPFYERIESDVDGFVMDGYAPTDNNGNLDYLVDMRASNLDPAAGWHGFHAVERDLWKRGAITPSTKKLAAELQKNVGLLQTLTGQLTYKPEDLANGAAGLLEEVQANKIKGEEELYSHIDLVDFAANVEGAEQAFAFLKPGLTEIDPDLTTQVADEFDQVKTMLKDYEDPTALGGYVTYTAALKASDSAKLSRAIQALQEPLAKIAEKVATAQ